MVHPGPLWTLVLLAGAVALVLELVKLLFRVGGAHRRESGSSSADTFCLPGESCTTDKDRKTEGNVPSREFSLAT